MCKKINFPQIKDIEWKNLKEFAWFLVAFSLFVISGPFSIFAVLPTLFAIPQDENAIELKPILSHEIK